MNFIRLTDPADSRYGAAMGLYAMSFPLHEQRLPASQRSAISHPDYHFDLVYEQESFVGLMLYWETAQLIYVEHFCMLPALRGKGGGGRALALLAEKGKTVVLEIDPPVDDISNRRRAFYLRSGFCENGYTHVHPPYRREFPGHDLMVLSRPAPLPREEYEAFSAYLRDTVMAQ